MKLTPVSSSNIAALGYDEKEGKLHVKFNSSGAVWVYSGVLMETYEEFMSASSIGSYFFHHIKGKYAAEKV